MPFTPPVLSLALISPYGALNWRSNGPTAPCTTSRAWSQRCGSKSPPMPISAGSTRHAPNSIECSPSTPSRPSPAFASTFTIWHRKFSNSRSPACASPACRRGEPPCSRDPEGLLWVDSGLSFIVRKSAAVGGKPRFVATAQNGDEHLAWVRSYLAIPVSQVPEIVVPRVQLCFEAARHCRDPAAVYERDDHAVFHHHVVHRDKQPSTLDQIKFALTRPKEPVLLIIP